MKNFFTLVALLFFGITITTVPVSEGKKSLKRGTKRFGKTGSVNKSKKVKKHEAKNRKERRAAAIAALNATKQTISIVNNSDSPVALEQAVNDDDLGWTDETIINPQSSSSVQILNNNGVSYRLSCKKEKSPRYLGGTILFGKAPVSWTIGGSNQSYDFLLSSAEGFMLRVNNNSSSALYVQNFQKNRWIHSDDTRIGASSGKSIYIANNNTQYRLVQKTKDAKNKDVYTVVSGSGVFHGSDLWSFKVTSWTVNESANFSYTTLNFISEKVPTLPAPVETPDTNATGTTGSTGTTGETGSTGTVIGDTGVAASTGATGTNSIDTQAAADKAAADKAAADKAATDQAATDQAAKDQAAKDQAAKDQAAKDQAANDQAAKDQAAKDQAAKDQAAKNQPTTSIW